MINNYCELVNILHCPISYIALRILEKMNRCPPWCVVGSGGLRPVFSECAYSTETVSPSCRIEFMINDYGCIAE